ncbi:MAG: hypothetical protein NW224_17730 [Leptolyngbyaceae cyanobacterium bins.302]|nr:hypothetical protein [Leptolyngbyaceae cyanobacterium bins.302]
MVELYAGVSKDDYDKIKECRDCLSDLLEKSMGKAAATDDQGEQDELLHKAERLKVEVDNLNAIIRNSNTKAFYDLSVRFQALTQETREKLDELKRTVENLKTVLELATALDAALEIAAGIASKMT